MNFESDFDNEASLERVWMLVPKKRDAYVPGLDGNFYQAFDQAVKHSAFWRTPTEIWEVDPAKYRRAGGLKKLWATVSVPEGSPVRNKVAP